MSHFFKNIFNSGNDERLPPDCALGEALAITGRPQRTGLVVDNNHVVDTPITQSERTHLQFDMNERTFRARETHLEAVSKADATTFVVAADFFASLRNNNSTSHSTTSSVSGSSQTLVLPMRKLSVRAHVAKSVKLDLQNGTAPTAVISKYGAWIAVETEYGKRSSRQTTQFSISTTEIESHVTNAAASAAVKSAVPAAAPASAAVRAAVEGTSESTSLATTARHSTRTSERATDLATLKSLSGGVVDASDETLLGMECISVTFATVWSLLCDEDNGALKQAWQKLFHSSWQCLTRRLLRLNFPSAQLPRVVLCGTPGGGKSSYFNRACAMIDDVGGLPWPTSGYSDVGSAPGLSKTYSFVSHKMPFANGEGRISDMPGIADPARPSGISIASIKATFAKTVSKYLIRYAVAGRLKDAACIAPSGELLADSDLFCRAKNDPENRRPTALIYCVNPVLLTSDDEVIAEKTLIDRCFAEVTRAENLSGMRMSYVVTNVDTFFKDALSRSQSQLSTFDFHVALGAVASNRYLKAVMDHFASKNRITFAGWVSSECDEKEHGRPIMNDEANLLLIRSLHVALGNTAGLA